MYGRKSRWPVQCHRCILYVVLLFVTRVTNVTLLCSTTSRVCVTSQFVTSAPNDPKSA